MFFWSILLTASPHAGAVVMEEVIVVAQKREQKLTDIGISITALSGEQMDRLGFDNAQQITNMAPGVSTVQPNGEANYSIAMRGVANSDFTTNVESPVALYLDEVYISQMSNAGFMLFDMERAEVLRGPQGTLYGRNATGGLVHFITRKPSSENGGFFELGIGDYDRVSLEGAVNVVLTDAIATRVSFSDHNGDGYVKNRLGGELNDANDRSVRWQVFFAPSNDSSLLMNMRRSVQDINTGFYENVSSIIPGQLTPGIPNPVEDGYVDLDGDVYAGDYDRLGFNDLKTSGYTATYKSRFGEFALTSITDYSSVERRYIEDSDASPVPLFSFFLTTDARQISQELRLEANYHKLHWVSGLYYLDLDMADSNGGISETFMGGVYADLGLSRAEGSEAGLANPYESSLKSFSVFGQLEVDLTNDISLTIGGRLIQHAKDFHYQIIAMEFLNPASQLFDARPNRDQEIEILSYSGSRKQEAGRIHYGRARWVSTGIALMIKCFLLHLIGELREGAIMPLFFPS